MVNKKAGIIALSLLTAALLAVGGTIAYFTARAEVENVVTMGNVKISLTEPSFMAANPDGTIGPIVPGDTIAKDPTITNTGSNPCYVRVKLDVKAEKGTQEEYDASVLEDVIETLAAADAESQARHGGTNYANPDFNINTSKWVLKDGYYYYQLPLDPGAVVKFFDTVSIPATWGNKYADVSYKITVKAEAVQSKNFETKLVKQGSKIVGWNVTVEN